MGPLGVQRMAAEGAAVQVEPFKAGSAGITEQSLPFVLSCIREGKHDEILMAWADAQLRKAGITGRGPGDLDFIKRAAVLLDAVRAQTSYAPDPAGSEMIKKPHLLLCLKDRCIPVGDCDDLTGTLGAAMSSVGIPTYAVHQKFGGGAQEHILLGVIDEGGRKWYVDPSTNDPPYQGSRARSENWLSPMDVPSKSTGLTGPEFVTLGAPGIAAPASMDPIFAQCGIGRAPSGGSRPVGLGIAGIVTPGDVLAYRTMWDQYVLDSVRSGLSCALSMNATAANQQDPQTKSNLQGQALAIQTQANDVLSEWNLYAGANYNDAFFVMEGAQILQTFQQTVLDAGQLRQNITTGPLTCQLIYPVNGQRVQAVGGPDPSLQAQIIARIEGLGILGQGVLQILLGTTSNGLQAAGSAAQWLGKQAKKAVEAAFSPWPWIIATVLGGTAVAIIYAPEIKTALKAKPRKG